KRDPVEPERATTAVFYSISNCQRGLAGVSFGHFLIKQVVEEVSREIPRLATFITLSPAPNFAEWLKRERAKEGSGALGAGGRAGVGGPGPPGWGAGGGARRDGSRAAAASGRLVLSARARRPRRAARFGCAFPSRQRRAARTAQLPRRHVGAGAAAITWIDGKLPLRPRAHRAEPRGLCAAARDRRGKRSDAPCSRADA